MGSTALSLDFALPTLLQPVAAGSDDILDDVRGASSPRQTSGSKADRAWLLPLTQDHSSVWIYEEELDF